MAALPERWEVRAEFAALLSAELVGAGRLAKAVYSYTVKDFGAEMPVLVLGSGGTRRVPFTARGSHPGYLIDLYIFVLYAEIGPDADSGTGELTIVPATGAAIWDEQASEETLDRIESQVRELLDRNQKGATWKSVTYNGDTTTEIIQVGDASYRRELVPLLFNVF